MTTKRLIKELGQVTQQIKSSQVELVKDKINSSKKIYVCGEGRSGLMIKAFAMRLARSEKPVYVIGETVTPPIQKGDLLIAASGSGETKTVLQTVKICRMLKGYVIGLTATSDSSLTKVAHEVILIPATLPKRLGNIYQLRELIGVPERPPLASVFELATLLFLEVVAFSLDDERHKRKNGKELLPS